VQRLTKSIVATKKDYVSQLFTRFEEARHDVDGLECWSARDLQEIFGYSEWRNFANAIGKAIKACESAG
jgi:DNA-damage-inducible protein D